MPDVRVPSELAGPLRTERLVLRTMTPGDVDDIHAYRSRDDVCRHLPFEPRSREQVADVFFTIVSTANATGEIGWTLHPDFHGKGYMTEAAQAVLDIALGSLGLHRVRAELDPRNRASIALCERLGMREEAHFVEDLWLKGAWAGTLIYAILDREWKARPPTG